MPTRTPAEQAFIDSFKDDPPLEPAKPTKLAPLPILVGIDEAERERRAMEWFDSNLGPGDERALDHLLAIATGQASTEALSRMGDPVTKRPSFGERIAAWDLLMTRHRGRPAQKIEVADARLAEAKWDPDSLTLEELRELKKLTEKATSPVVDAEFTTEDK